MNISAEIRAWLSTRKNGGTVREAVEALGMSTRDIGSTVGRMYRDGILTRTGERRAYRYTVAREIPPPMTKEQARARKAERERIRQQTREWGRRSMAEYRADLAAKRAVREEAADEARRSRQAAIAERQAARQRVRQEAALRRAQAAMQRLKAQPPKPEKVQPSVVRKPDPVIPKAIPVESVEAWMARTGKRPEPLPNGAVSRPFRHIGQQT